MPTLHAEIHNAIESHKAWKQILNAAVATGKSSLDPAVVCLDDRCPFGRWLHGLNDGVKASPRWQCVSTVHAEFHQEAAKVLTLALGGQRSAARASSAYASAFAGVSERLMTELIAWRRQGF